MPIRKKMEEIEPSRNRVFKPNISELKILDDIIERWRVKNILKNKGALKAKKKGTQKKKGKKKGTQKRTNR